MRHVWTLKDLQDSTGLLPYIIGQRVAWAANLSNEAAERFAAYVETRALHLFNHNQTFRRRLLSKRDPLGTMQSFAQHWLAGKQTKGPKLRSNNEGTSSDQFSIQ